MSYEEAVVDLQPGDVLLIFTDGVPEALSPDEEEFGEDRLRALLQRVADFSSVDEMAAQISQELGNWIDDAEQYDDLTFILVKVK
jgi:sigma-B regulation protein RsbU (phosphoserine phosphatase)